MILMALAVYTKNKAFRALLIGESCLSGDEAPEVEARVALEVQVLILEALEGGTRRGGGVRKACFISSSKTVLVTILII